MRVQDVLEQAGLRDLVVLRDGAGLTGGALLLGEPLLALLLAAADLAQLVVVVEVGRQPEVEEGEADGELQVGEGRELGTPGLLGHGPVRGEPAADQGAVDELEGDGRGPYGDVDG